MRSKFAAAADDVVYGDREQTYDDPNRNFRKIAQVWSAILDREVSMEQVALMMVGLKIVRESHRHSVDNVIDAHGYLMCLERILYDKPSPDSREVPISQLGKAHEEMCPVRRHPDADTTYNDPRVHTSAPLANRKQ